MTSEIFPEYSWNEFNLVYFNPYKILVYSKKHSSLTAYKIDDFTEEEDYNNLLFGWKLNPLNISLSEPQDIHFHNSRKNLVCFTSFEQSKSQLILLDDEQNIEKSMMIDLEPNANKVLVNMNDDKISEINLFQSTCDEETKECRILRQDVDLENNSTSEVEVIKSIHSRDCILQDIFFLTADFKKCHYKDVIFYVCKKQVAFPLTNSFDYLTLRAVFYSKPFKNQEIISINLNFLEKEIPLNHHEKIYKKYLDKISGLWTENL